MTLDLRAQIIELWAFIGHDLGPPCPDYSVLGTILDSLCLDYSDVAHGLGPSVPVNVQDDEGEEEEKWGWMSLAL
jgi:hypothetical protein